MKSPIHFAYIRPFAVLRIPNLFYFKNCVAEQAGWVRVSGSTLRKGDYLNSELCKQALAKVGNPNILVNLISKRVRQLTSGGGSGRPLVADTAGLGWADIALIEIIEEKLGWELLETLSQPEPAPRKRKKAA